VTAGPEGWLSRTPLLPCHYFVHSFGSPATYRLRHGAVRSRVDAAAVVHMERNYGEAFPVGYTWAQASAPNRAAFLVVTGGLFVIGPLTTLTYVIGFRAPGVSAADGEPHIGLNEARGTAWDFRTTDLDRIQAQRRPCQGELTLNATSRDGRRTLLIHLNAPPTSFGEPMPIPTQGGFSSSPGCRESYAATANVTALMKHSRRSPGWRPVLQMSVPLAALEFGGSWQC